MAMLWMELMGAGWLQYYVYDDIVRQRYGVFTDNDYDEYVSLIIDNTKKLHIYRGVLYRDTGMDTYLVLDESGYGIVEHYVWSMGVYGVRYRVVKPSGEDMEYLVEHMGNLLGIRTATLYRVDAGVWKLDKYIYDISVDGNAMIVTVDGRYRRKQPDEKIVYALAVVNGDVETDMPCVERHGAKYIVAPVIYTLNLRKLGNKNPITHYSIRTETVFW